MTNSCKVIDTTLREGEQSPGVSFTLSEKKSIIDHLAIIGIDEVEVGISSKLHPCTGPLIDYCRTHYPEMRVSLWSRCRENDIEYGVDAKPHIISLSIPSSDLHLQQRLNKDRSWAWATMTKGIQLAKERGFTVSVGFEDATRADPFFLQEMALQAELVGADRIRLADTVGICSPGQTADIISRIKRKLTTCSLGFHAHNDFGMATANSIAALEAGGRYVDVVALGLGERAGCARLEEIIGFLSLARNNQSYRPEKLKPLAELVASLAERTIPPNRPIVGANIFSCETGLHLQGLQRNPETYEPFRPERVLAKRQLLFGAKSGRRSLEEKLRQLKIADFEELSESAVECIRKLSAGLKRPLNDSELQQLFTTLHLNP